MHFELAGDCYFFFCIAAALANGVLAQALQLASDLKNVRSADVRERQGQCKRGGIDFDVERAQFEFEDAVELGAEGVEGFEIGADQFFGGEAVADGVARGNGFTFFGTGR